MGTPAETGVEHREREASPEIRFRNYVPKDPKLRQFCLPRPSVDELEKQIAKEAQAAVQAAKEEASPMPQLHDLAVHEQSRAHTYRPIDCSCWFEMLFLRALITCAAATHPSFGCNHVPALVPVLCQDILSQVAPRRPNWDLKRDVERKITILSRRTDKAIIQLIREKIEQSKTTKELLKDSEVGKKDFETSAENLSREEIEIGQSGESGATLKFNFWVKAPEIGTIVKPTADGIRATYYSNPFFRGPPTGYRDEESIDLKVEGTPAFPGLPIQTFSVRWDGYLVPSVSDRYRLFTYADCGIRVFLEDSPIIVDRMPMPDEGAAFAENVIQPLHPSGMTGVAKVFSGPQVGQFGLFDLALLQPVTKPLLNKMNNRT
ncbi:hypothetical protein ACSSS7_000190 [Eimeria intestinalis]